MLGDHLIKNLNAQLANLYNGLLLPTCYFMLDTAGQ